MSKRMRFWMMGVLGVMMAGLVCVNVYALTIRMWLVRGMPTVLP